MKYKAVGFDYGGVIKGRPSSIFVQKVCDLLGITKRQYEDVYFQHNKKVNRGEINWREFWTIILEELGQPGKIERIIALSNSSAEAKINQELLDIVDDLRRQGLKTGLLSNNTLEAAETIRKGAIDKHFDVVHVSAETGFVKPEPEAFIHFAEALEVKPIELIFVDDSEKSLSTAKKIGFEPILFKDYESLSNKLAELGLVAIGDKKMFPPFKSSKF